MYSSHGSNKAFLVSDSCKANAKKKIEDAKVGDGHTTQWPKEKAQKDKHRSTKLYTENQKLSNANPTKTGRELRCSGRVAVPAPHVAPVMLLLLQTRWQVMNEERTGLWLRQMKHIRGHLWHKYSVTEKSCTMLQYNSGHDSGHPWKQLERCLICSL